MTAWETGVQQMIQQGGLARRDELVAVGESQKLIRRRVVAGLLVPVNMQVVALRNDLVAAGWTVLRFTGRPAPRSDRRMRADRGALCRASSADRRSVWESIDFLPADLRVTDMQPRGTPLRGRSAHLRPDQMPGAVRARVP